MTANNAMREAFEKWYQEKYPLATSRWGKFDLDENGEYRDFIVEVAFQSRLAALAECQQGEPVYFAREHGEAWDEVTKEFAQELALRSVEYEVRKLYEAAPLPQAPVQPSHLENKTTGAVITFGETTDPENWTPLYRHAAPLPQTVKWTKADVDRLDAALVECFGTSGAKEVEPPPQEAAQDEPSELKEKIKAALAEFDEDLQVEVYAAWKLEIADDKFRDTHEWMLAWNYFKAGWIAKQAALPRTSEAEIRAKVLEEANSGCRNTGGICACRAGGSFGGCAKERAYCCTNQPAQQKGGETV